MKVNDDDRVPVSFRLDPRLMKRLREVTSAEVWPPPPTQTEIVTRGIELVLRKLEAKRGKARAQV